MPGESLRSPAKAVEPVSIIHSTPRKSSAERVFPIFQSLGSVMNFAHRINEFVTAKQKIVMPDSVDKNFLPG